MKHLAARRPGVRLAVVPRERARRTSQVAPRLFAATVLAAVAATTAACGAGPSPTTSGSAPSENPLDEALDSPLGQALGEIYVPDEDGMIAHRLRVEEHIVQCMADQGFEYVIGDVEGQIRSYSPASHAQRGDEKWVVENGYGVTTADGTPRADPFADPNADYLAGLSQASRTEFDLALAGESAEDDSCITQAVEKVGAADPWEQPEFAPLKEAIGGFQLQMWDELPKSPGMAAATTAWSDCMAEAGFAGLSARDDARLSIDAALADLQVEAARVAGEEPGGVGSEPSVPVPPAQLAELRTTELATALADLRCGEESGYDTTLLELQHAAEEQFLIDNQTAIDELVAAYEQQ